MTERTEAEKQAAFDAYMDVSQPLHQEFQGDLIGAGQSGDDILLRSEIRSILNMDTRSSMKVVMICEALNAYEEGCNDPT